jgi:opacity protein-like surface antigen
MSHRNFKSGLGALCFLLAASAGPACAEWYADLYGGVAYTPPSDITLVVGSPMGPADHLFHDVKWDNSAVLGARAGYWFDSAPWYGIGLDVFRFDADIPSQTVELTILGNTAPATLKAIDVANTVIAFDVLRLRYPLQVSAEYPKGRLQPYFNAGPALFKVHVTNRENTELSTRTATDSSVGYKIGGGLSWQLTSRASIFGEYRFTHVRSEAMLQGTITGAQVPMKFDLDTHHVVAGVSFGF